jgi:hypothetical protein
MSKHMQLTVRIQPYYRKGLAGVYPEIARRLGYIDEAWVGEGPSLFHIVGRLDKLLFELEADPPFREILLKYKAKLQECYEGVESRIADWHLSEADKRLYEIEDLFDEIEAELKRI